MKRVLALLLAGPAWAEPTALEPLSRRDQLLGFEAVGRIDIADGGFCTGTLISDFLVLTAAHCVFDGQGNPVPTDSLSFRAGYVAGEALASAGVTRVLTLPGHDPDAPVSPDSVRQDVALLVLDAVIPSALAAPFKVQEPGTGAVVSVLSYAQGREEVLSWQRTCDVLDRAEGLVALNCDVTFGASGAPVLDRSGPRARIVSIISAGGPTEQGVVAYGMELPDLVAALMAQLDGGPPVARAGNGRSRDIGARFVKP